MIKSKPGKQFAAASQALCLQVLTDDPGDNTYGHTPLHIQTGDGKRYIVLFAGHPVVIAGVGYRIDAIGEAHIDNALVDICDTAGILALDTALLQVVPVGVLGNPLDVSLDAQVLQTVAPHAENTDQNLIAYGKTLMGITDPIPGKVTGKDGGFNAENFHAHNLFSHCNHTRLDDAALIDTVHTGSIRIQIENLAFAQHGSDIEQQEGRILRQGNQNDKVKIFRYVTEGTFDSYSWQLIENKQKFIGQIMTSKSPVRSCEDVDEAALSYAEVKALATGNPYIKEKMDLDIQVSKLKLMKANHTSQKYRLEDNITQHYPHQIAIFKERIEGFTADMNKYAKNKPEDKEQFFMQVGGKSYTDKKEAGTAIIAMCKEIKGINASADVGEYLGFKLNVTFDSFNNKFVMNVKGAMSHPMEVGSDPLGNITRINNVLKAMPSQLEEAQMKLSNVKHQLETAKAEVDKPFSQEAELAEKLERLAELNSLLNMDEKGDDAIGMDDEAAEPEKPQETVKTVDNKRDEVADMPAKQSNLGKTAVGGKLSDRPAERTSLQEKLAAMKARVSGTPAGRDAADKTKKKEEIL